MHESSSSFVAGNKGAFAAASVLLNLKNSVLSTLNVAEPFCVEFLTVVIA